MNMTISYKILEDLFLIEIILIIALILITYVFKLSVDLARKRREKITKDIENYFKNLISNNKEFEWKLFPKKWKKIYALTAVIIDLDSALGSSNENWKIIKSVLLNKITLPLARKNAYSRRWVYRFFSSEIFGLSSENQDEPHIIKLSKDKIPLVFLHAITAAIQSHSVEATNIIITRIAKMYWVSQSIFLEIFKQADPKIYQVIESRLKTENDPLIRAICYKILLNFPEAKHITNEKKDFNSENIELKLAVFKYLIHVDHKAADTILIEGLQDKHWEVRLVAIHRLGKMKVMNAISKIADCLNDENWWVKISAAEALKSLGSEGEKILKLKSPELDLIPFKATDHIAHTLW